MGPSAAWGLEPGQLQPNQRQEATGALAIHPGSLWNWDCCEVFSIPSGERSASPTGNCHPGERQWGGSAVQVSVPKATTPWINTALGNFWSFML